MTDPTTPDAELIGRARETEWWCRRCKTVVRFAEDMGEYVAGKCRCHSSPSPWEQIGEDVNHHCKVCGALWVRHPDDATWSLCSQSCGSCCDNAPMGDQIVPLFTPEAAVRAEAETERLSHELDITDADHIALWLEENMEDATLGWLACRIIEAHEAALTSLQARDEVIEQCAAICDDADKSTHPADLADAIRALLEAAPSPMEKG